MGWRVPTIAAFALASLTASPSLSGVFWVTIIGFMIGWMAAMLESMQVMQ
jgi:hypothetical protein